MHVGRTVAGLPTCEPEFATLPTYFVKKTTQLHDLLKLYFPNAPGNIQRVCEFTLASIIYHKKFLIECLPKEHPIFLSSLFRNESKLQMLYSCVRCEVAN